MPLFFFISGYLHKVEDSTLNYIKRKNKLIKKYLIGSGILFLFWLLIGRRVGLTALYSGSIWENILGIFYGSQSNKIGIRMDWGIQMWFIPAVIMTGVFSNFILNGKKVTLTLAFLICLNILNINLPFNLENIILILPFYILGYYTKNSNFSLFKYTNMKKYAVIIFFILGLLAYRYNGSLDMRTGTYKNLFCMYLAAFSIIAVLFYYFRNQKEKSLITLIGSFSLEIMILHMIILKFLKGIYHYGFKIDVEKSIILFPIINSILQIMLIVLVFKFGYKIKSVLEIKIMRRRNNNVF